MTKQEQLKWNKEPKQKRVNKYKPTQHEQEFLTWLQSQDYSCFACGGKNGIEYHHIKNRSTDRKVHTSLIPLCGISCHRIGEFSAHGNPNWFRANFPIDIQKARAKEIYEDFLECTK